MRMSLALLGCVLLSVPAARGLALPSEVQQMPCGAMPSASLQDELAEIGLKSLEVPSDQIEKYMPLGADIPGLPLSIQGIWWMDGNPGGLLVSLGSAHWDPFTHTATLRMMGPGSYSFRADRGDTCQLQQLARANIRFVIEFNAAETYATLVNESSDENGNPRVNNDAEYTMTLVQNGHWIRHSVFLNGALPMITNCAASCAPTVHATLPMPTT